MVPDLPVDDWTTIDVAVATGLAGVGAPVRVVLPNHLKCILLCEGHIRDRDKVRIRVQNIGSRAFAESELAIRLHPLGRRRSLFPEIKFNLDEVQI